jgi:Protein of unknown function (DUF3563)
MKHVHHALPDNSLIGTCIMLAHSTFYDALPANAERREPIAPANVGPSKRAPREGLVQRLVNALDNWFYRQRVREREAYLAKAKDIFELEYRMRQLER